MIDDLLDLAEHLARLEPRRPKQISLRRSVATAYYAVFHALADLCASELAGTTKPWSVFTPVYRALDHGSARRYFERGAVQKRLDTKVMQIGDVFLLLQEERIRADYDPEPFTFGRKEILGFCAQARFAVETIRALPAETRLSLAVGLIIKQR